MSVRDNEYLFRQRLRERFGPRSDDFSKPLLGVFRGFWRDGVELGRRWPNERAIQVTNRRLYVSQHFGDRCTEFSSHLRELFIGLWDDALAYGRGKMCARCGSREDVRYEAARTQYEPTEDDPEPNADIPFCRPCAADHHEHWDGMWAEYYAGRL